MKYFVLGALSSGLLLYGCSLIYGFSGHVDFAGIAAALSREDAIDAGLIVGFVFLLSGLAFKISAAPFHMWTPDVYEGAPTPIVAFFSVAPKLAVLALLIRVLSGPFEAFAEDWRPILEILAALSMTVGAFGAIGQTNIKRLMAYSTIGHMGYVLMGLAAFSASSSVLYMTIYAVMSVGVFACLLSMDTGEAFSEKISDLSGLARTRPFQALVFLVLLFSLAGLPPFAGFFAKYFVFRAALGAELYILVVIGALASVVSAFYYIRIVKLMYFDEGSLTFVRPQLALRMTMAVSALLVGCFALYPHEVVSMSERVTRLLFAGGV